MLRSGWSARKRVPWRRCTGAWLAASLVSLLLSQPFHERVDPAPVAAASLASADAPGHGAPERAATHDRDRCLQCRALAQTRQGLRAPVQQAPRATGAAVGALPGEAPAAARSAPEPSLAGPRAPPLSALSA